MMLLLKIQSLAYGYSGVCSLERLVDFYNNDILPVIYTQVRWALRAIWHRWPICRYRFWEPVKYISRTKSASEILQIQLATHRPAIQRGLALLNGTQFMSAYGAHVLIKACKFSWLGRFNRNHFTRRIRRAQRAVQ
jgi:histidine ammonia-lyase